jgi:seryl-tRNA synthetase
MKFECSAALEFSSMLEPAKDEIAKLISEANSSLLLKGVPKGKESEASQVASHSAEGSVLELRITSGRYARAHDALLRLRALFNQRLGKDFKLGVRGMKFSEYKISGIELERPALVPFKIHRFVKNITVKDKLVDLELECGAFTEDLLEKGAVDRIVELVQDKVKQQYYEGKTETAKPLWASPEKKMLYDKDPALEMEQRAWLRRTRAKGQFVYGANATALVNALKGLLVDNVYKPLGFAEMIFPKFEPWDVPKRSGHAKTFYSDVYFVSVPKVSDPRVWEEEKDYFKVTGEVLVEGVARKTAPVGIMSYAQCPPFWQYLEGRVIKDESLPLKAFDWSGPTYRNEAGGTQGIARLEEFHRIETLWVGTPAQVGEIAGQLQEKFRLFFEKTLDLEMRENRVLPWWMAHEHLQEEEKETGGAEPAAARGSAGNVSTIDFEAYLPYRGPRGKSEWLEIQNVSNNGEKYPKAFSVKRQKEDLWSGCAGGSFERYACAFLSQKGLDPKNWPVEVSKRFEFQPEIKFA